MVDGTEGSAAKQRGAETLHLGDAIDFFLNSKRSGGRSQKTVEDYKKKLALFQSWAASRISEDEDDPEVDLPVSYIDADMIERYVVYLKDTKKMADSSRKNYLAVMRSFFATVSKRLKVADPMSELDEVRFHSPAPKRSFLTKREADMLLSSMDPETVLGLRDHAIYSVMLYAGLRIEEVTSLVVDDVNLAKGEEEVRVARGKGNKERRIPVGEKLAKSVKRYLKVRGELVDPVGEGVSSLFLNNRGQRVSENTVRRNLYKYVRQSRLRKTEIRPHDLRRTFATWYLQDNPAHHRELAELMGHSDLSQVMKYALSDAERARAGVAKL
jgi:site-specific recombinase XerD